MTAEQNATGVLDVNVTGAFTTVRAAADAYLARDRHIRTSVRDPGTRP